jgi:hypothetical protein
MAFYDDNTSKNLDIFIWLSKVWCIVNECNKGQLGFYTRSDSGHEMA